MQMMQQMNNFVGPQLVNEEQQLQVYTQMQGGGAQAQMFGDTGEKN